MSAQPLSPTEAATVARFDAAQPAPESWGHPHRWIGTHDHGPVCSVCGMRKPEGRDDGLARQFHETYERLAPAFGYETRRESAVPWEDVPEQNRRLMIAVCEEVTAALRAKAAAVDRVRTVVEELEDRKTDLRDLDAVDRLFVGTQRAAAHQIRQALDGPV